MHDGHHGSARYGTRLVGLDALRGLAAIAVCFFHWEHMAFGTATAEQSFRLGLLGVELFFVISGFVILMVAERARSVPYFVLARVLRLYPAYLASVALTAVYVLWVGKYDIGAVLVNLTMLQSFFDVPNITNPYWTLAFEISFYGLLTAVLATGAIGQIERLALAWLAAALAYRLLVPVRLGFDPERPLAQLGYIMVAPQFAPFFVIGLMVYRLHVGQLRRSGALALAAALALTLLGRGDFALVPGPIYAVFACLAAAAVWRAAGSLPRWPALAPLAWIGIVSYPLYLVHCTVANLSITAGERFGLSAPTAVGLSIPISLGLAALLHYGLERPVASAVRRRTAQTADVPDGILTGAETRQRQRCALIAPEFGSK